MGPNYRQQLEFNSPLALPETNNPAESAEGGPEQLVRTPEATGTAANQQPIAVAPPAPLPMVPVGTSAATAAPLPMPANPSSSNPAVADDKDLIEKVWVEKAKKIIEGTRSDPRRQTREMNVFKADYLKKRYNKDLKIVEE